MALGTIVGADITSGGTSLTDDAVEVSHIQGATSVLSSGTNTHAIVAQGTSVDSAVGWAPLTDVCFLKDTKILLNNSEYKNIQDLSENDILKSSNIQDLDNNNVDIEYLLNWYTKDFKYQESNTKVKELYKHSTEQYYIINNELKLTPEHLLFVKKNDIYEWYSAKNIKIGYDLLNSENKFIKVESIEEVNKRSDVYNIKIEGTMNYYADNYLVHGSSKCDECSIDNE
jgi:intein/homing endonuclease